MAWKVLSNRKYERPPQVPIFNNDLAAFLIMKEHLLYRQKRNFKKKQHWIYWFVKDDTIYSHMKDFIKFKKDIVRIRTESKRLDKERKRINKGIENMLKGVNEYE